MTPLVRERNHSVFWITRIMAKLLLSPFFQIETGGIEHLPKKSAFILLPKHQRWEDIPLLGVVTPRPLYYIAKYELFMNPVSKWLLSSLGGIPLNRSRPLESRRSLKALIEFLRKGEGVVIFPEGTYYKNHMGRGHVGLIRMIRSRFTVPFVPVGINYSADRGRSLVRINYGRPLYEGSSLNTEALLERVIKEIARLSGFS